MRKILLMFLSGIVILAPINQVNALEKAEDKNCINLECELLDKNMQTYNITVNDEEYIITVEDVAVKEARNYSNVTLGTSFNKLIKLSNGVLTGGAYFVGTTNSTQGKVTNVNAPL